MSFLDSRIDIGAIISAITHEHANRAIHLIEQRCNLRAVVGVATGQRASDNLARDCVQADMHYWLRVFHSSRLKELIKTIKSRE